MAQHHRFCVPFLAVLVASSVLLQNIDAMASNNGNNNRRAALDPYIYSLLSTAPAAAAGSGSGLSFETVNFVLPTQTQFYSSGSMLDENPHRLRMLSNPIAPKLTSQNHRFMTKTPERDLHYATILKQQEQATIRHPFQAFQVAKDQASMRGHMLRNTLQTSDDDVYEVESAPVMKAASPYQQYFGPSTSGAVAAPVARYRPSLFQPLLSPPTVAEFPITMSLESSSNNGFQNYPHQQPHHHLYHYQQHPQSYYHHSSPSSSFLSASPPSYAWPQKRQSSSSSASSASSVTEQDGVFVSTTPIEHTHYPMRLSYYDHNYDQPSLESRLSKKLTSSIKVGSRDSDPKPKMNPKQSSGSHDEDGDGKNNNLFMSIGLSSNNGNDNNDQQGEDMMTVSQSRIQPTMVVYGTRQSNKIGSKNNNRLTNAHQRPDQIHIFQNNNNSENRSMIGTPALPKPVWPTSTTASTSISTTTTTTTSSMDQQQRQEDPTSSWLDMGAYSSQSGSFGWYTDTPIVEHHGSRKNLEKNQQNKAAGEPETETN